VEVAVRDGSIYQAGFGTAAEGARFIGVSAVEVAIDRDGGVRSLTSDRTLDLTTDTGLDGFRRELAETGLRVCAFLCAQDFNAPDPQPHVRWVVQGVRAAEAVGAPALRIDSAMTGQAELPLEDRVRIFADAVTEVLRATPGSEVALGIENHGRQGNDPEWMRGVIRPSEAPAWG
jgi:sugar phosphate isomerase/epimerase